MSKFIRHPFHLVNESPWPLWMSVVMIFSVLSLLDLIFSKKMGNWSLPCFSVVILTWISYQWWKNIAYESTILGLHPLEVQLGLRLGMILFIVSEIYFFLSFFWAFFHSSIVPIFSVGFMWPPLGIVVLNPFLVPLLNTMILLSSGITVSLSHFSILGNNYVASKNWLIVTIVLGTYFTILQYVEYVEASFDMSDGVYGSTFFLATGFHGFHVMVGTLMLMVMNFRLMRKSFSEKHHFGFEAAAWYWHFVDVVWLFLFLTIYSWGALNY